MRRVKMPKIKITETPDGEAPEEIRKAWIDVELDYLTKTSPNTSLEGVVTGNPVKRKTGGFAVYSKEAIGALKEKNKEAAEWWEKNFSIIKHPILIFNESCCKEIV